MNSLKMHKGFVELNKVPTQVVTWGRWIEETPTKKNEDIILCIPGNPGLTGYYKMFLETLYTKLQCPVWIVGQAGCEEPKSSSPIKVPSLDGNEKLYDVQGQIKNKLEFFQKYVPAGARVHLIGHSIGSHICLQLLKNPEVKAKVKKVYLLFPTIENMLETQNGWILTNIIKYILWIIYALAWVFTFFPPKVQAFLISIYFFITSIQMHNIPTTIDIIKPQVLQKIFFLAFDEMVVVRSLDPDDINSNKNILKLYYGATDNWAPPTYCKKIIREYPGIDAQICVRDFNHAFVLRNSEAVGNMVADWITLGN